MEDPRLFLVRVWRQRGFRATARAADEAEAHSFTNAGELGAFFATSAPGEGGAPPACSATAVTKVMAKPTTGPVDSTPFTQPSIRGVANE
jgi:hypothetical protein